jgi:hypothetical protein
MTIVGLYVSRNLLKVVGKVLNFYRRDKQLLRSYRTGYDIGKEQQLLAKLVR